jgi:hypothetical protein
MPSGPLRVRLDPVEPVASPAMSAMPPKAEGISETRDGASRDDGSAGSRLPSQ